MFSWNEEHFHFLYTIFQEKRIYDLKKKNQELEKFKFVLDYKIKELKKQIEPRENDIKAMKEQIQEVGTKLVPGSYYFYWWFQYDHDKRNEIFKR